jgi:hypothetical protein
MPQGKKERRLPTGAQVFDLPHKEKKSRCCNSAGYQPAATGEPPVPPRNRRSARGTQDVVILGNWFSNGKEKKSRCCNSAGYQPAATGETACPTKKSSQRARNSRCCNTGKLVFKW